MLEADSSGKYTYTSVLRYLFSNFSEWEMSTISFEYVAEEGAVRSYSGPVLGAAQLILKQIYSLPSYDRWDPENFSSYIATTSPIDPMYSEDQC